MGQNQPAQLKTAWLGVAMGSFSALVSMPSSGFFALIQMLFGAGG